MTKRKLRGRGWFKATPILMLVVLLMSSCKQRPELRPLFNGKDLTGWHGMGHVDLRVLRAMSDEERAKKRNADMEDLLQHWTVENGEIVNDGHGVYLTSDEDFGNFEFHLEYKTVPMADSGIFLRANPQVQIWDPTNETMFKLGGDKGSGGLWNNSPGAPGKDPLVLADRPFGEWNDFDIVLIGSRATVHFNQQLVVDHAIMENYSHRDSPIETRGPFQLQTHGGEIRWRNIGVREIPAEEANRRLMAAGLDGFEPIFNGADLTSWDGAVDSYEVVDGAIMCKPDAGGHLYTKREYSDFVVRLEFLVPPSGNNGMAIRHPGGANVDSSQHAMCELQVLDNTAPEYAELDARQYHGSAYGMFPAQRGFQRPVGAWNFQEVTVRGSTIRVELNGNVILDCDLSEVTETMSNSAHPGRTRTSGHFGFAGHASPVQYRNVWIKEL
jgi:hypothetical protein